MYKGDGGVGKASPMRCSRETAPALSPRRRRQGRRGRISAYPCPINLSHKETLLPPRSIFLSGGSGFVGGAVIDELLKRHDEIKALVNKRPIATAGVESIRADLFDPPSLVAAMRGCTAVIHLVGIIAENPGAGVTFERMHFEATRNVVDAAKGAGVRRYIQMSALGTRADAKSEYHKTKWKAEEYLRASGLEWTILQPSMIHGPRGEFMKMEAAWARKQAAPFFFMPYFGRGLFGTGGAGLLQPVYVNDVARAFVEAIDKPATIGKTYALAGSDQVSWPQMHGAVSEKIVGKRRASIALPAWYAKALAAVVPRRLLPFNRDQVIMSQEDNTATPAEMAAFERDFGWRPGSFAATLAEYAAGL